MNYRTIIANVGVFLIGLTLFMYEITLTRLFSTLMWYHFVFIAISLAMLGWTIGGVYAFRWLNTLEKPASRFYSGFLGYQRLDVCGRLHPGSGTGYVLWL